MYSEMFLVLWVFDYRRRGFIGGEKKGPGAGALLRVQLMIAGGELIYC